MPVDFSSMQTSIESLVGPYQIPLMVIVGFAVAVWVVLTYRALQVHNLSEAAQLDRMLKHK